MSTRAVSLRSVQTYLTADHIAASIDAAEIGEGSNRPWTFGNVQTVHLSNYAAVDKEIPPGAWVAPAGSALAGVSGIDGG